MRFKINFRNILLYIILIIGIALLYTLIINTVRLPGFFYLDSTKISIENLMYYTWQVQVTIALISVTLTSLIIGRLDKKIYGQSVKEILMIIPKLLLTYVDKIIMVILLSVINLWFVMYGNLPGLEVIFILSIVAVVDLVIDSYEILFNPEKYEERIKRYIFNNLDAYLGGQDNKLSELIESIGLDNKELIENKQITSLEKNISFLLEMMLRFSSVPIKDKKQNEYIFNRIERNVISSVKLLMDNGEVEVVIDVINRIMSLDFNVMNKHWVIEEILDVLISKSKENCTEETYNKINKYILLDIFDNISLNDIEKSFLSICQFRCFYWVYKNDALSGFVKEEITNRFMNLLVPGEFVDLDADEYFIRKLTIYYITMDLIKQNDQKTFSVLIKSIYNNNAFSLNLHKPNKIYEIIITINIFIYYIVIKEGSSSDDYKKRASDFLYLKTDNDINDSLNARDFVVRIGAYIWDCYSSIKEEMVKVGWERSEIGKVKQLILPEAINEYFTFYSIINIDHYEFQEYINEKFNINHCYCILEHFDNNGFIRSDLKKNFTEFVRTYSCDINVDEVEKLNNKVKNFYISVNRLYVRLIIEQEKKYYQMDKVGENIGRIKQEVIKKLKENNFYTLVENKDIGGKEYCFEKELIYTSVLAEKTYLSGKAYEDLVADSIEEHLLDLIKNESHKYTFTDKGNNKIEKLFTYLNNKKFNVDAIINGKLSENWSITNNEEISRINDLHVFEENISNVYRLGKHRNEHILLRKKDYDIQIQVIQIEIKDISEKEISDIVSNLKEKEEFYYKINVVNKIQLLFNEDEVREYYSFKFKTLYVTFKIKHNIKPNDAIQVIK